MSIFWLASCLLLTVNTFSPDGIQKIVTGGSEVKKELPYFFALVPKTLNSNYVKRKLISLPGVEKVSKVSEHKVNGHVKNILAESKVALDDSLMSLDFSGLKIYLSASLKESSRKLIRNYVSRLAGESDVTLGSLHRPEAKNKSSQFFMTRYFSLVVSLVAGFIFMICLLSFWKTLEEAAFVYEQFQRKVKVFEKSLTYAHFPLLAVLLVGTFFNQSVAIAGLGFVTLSMLMCFILGSKFRTR